MITHYNHLNHSLKNHWNFKKKKKKRESTKLTLQSVILNGEQMHHPTTFEKIVEHLAKQVRGALL